MKGTEVIQHALKGTAHSLGMYLSDLSDADLLARTSPNANHIAWQLGHLVLAEGFLVKGVIPNAKYPELPAGFDAKHKKDTASKDTGFGTKDEYLNLFKKAREITIAEVAKLSDADLDKSNTGPLAAHAPTVGDLLLLVSNHTLMHAGQITSVRRKLGKPVLF